MTAGSTHVAVLLDEAVESLAIKADGVYMDATFGRGGHSRRILGKLNEKGLALIPLKIYFKENGRAKVELGLARGKREYDKRASLKEQQSNRELQREMQHNKH